MKKLVLTGLCATMLVACGQAEKTKTAEAVDKAVSEKPAAAATHAEKAALVSGINKENFDTSIRPQDNFYQYVNGTYIKNAVIPSDRTSIGAFYTLRDKSEKDVLNIIEELSKTEGLKKGSDEQKVADLYRAFMDEEKIEKLGLSPLQPDLDAIDAIKTADDLMVYLAKGEVRGISSPLQFYISVDAKVATEYRAHFWQGGLSLPDRDFYFNEEERFVGIRTAFTAHIIKMFELAGWKDPKGAAKTVMDMEMAMAKSHWTNTEVS